jgi:adenylate kinase family enzyme
MKRVLIIGSGGAGKSTFARRLSEKTGLEVIHLDVLYWKPNWVESGKDEWQKTIEEVIKRDSWIMDGNFSGTLNVRIPAADTVIFLDFPRLVCVYRIFKRLMLYRKGTRPDMAEGCGEKFDWEFTKFVWNYKTRSKPKVEALLKRFENEKTIVRLKSKSEVEKFLSNIPQIQ